MNKKKTKQLHKSIVLHPNLPLSNETSCNHKFVRFQWVILLISNDFFFAFLLSSIFIRRKYWIRENFRLPVFDGFTCFEMS